MKLKKILSTLSMVGILTLSATGMCFAADPQTAETPVYINIPATELDFSVTERINMTGTAGSVDLTADDLTVTNNGTMGTIEVTKMEASSVNGWSLVSGDTDFATLRPDAKQLSLKTDGQDLSAGPCTAAVKIKPANDWSWSFDAKTGAVSTAVNNEQCALITVTVQMGD